MIGLPAPLENLQRIRFATCNAIPAFENLLTGGVVRRRPSGIVDPLAIRVIAHFTRTFEVGGVRGGRGRGFEERENEEEGGEREEREEEEGGGVAAGEK